MNMKKISLLLFILCCGQWGMAQNIRSLFLDMPETFTPLLTSVNKADFIDFLDSKMKAKIMNKFNKTSEMKILSDSYILIQMSENTTWQMKVLPTSNSFVIAIIKTVKGPAADSSISFYSSDWKELSVSSFYEQPSIASFLKDEKASFKLNNDLQALDMSLIRLDFNADNNELIASLSTIDYLNKETREKVEPYFNKELVLSWEGGKYLMK